MNISNALGARAASKVIIDGVAKNKKKQRKWVILTAIIDVQKFIK